jgi:hypothetical protein
MSKEAAGKNVNSASGGRVVLRFRQKLLHALPTETSWLRVLHQLLILALEAELQDGRDLPLGAGGSSSRANPSAS